MPRARKASPRRMGPVGSDNWHAMLDGAEDILREEGYAALTSRRVAERIGVKQRLVYYYFKTMDDLIVETFRRLSVRELERLRNAASSARPLREIWYICVHAADARLISEFTALANRIPALRSEVIAFIEESRRIQVMALSAAPAGNNPQQSLPPLAAAIIATSVALSLIREAALGTTNGHAAVTDVIWRYIRELEPGN
ncbi:MAG: TetR/AcrR family transcriptional regulator [Sinobacteraceae bacterium]|nr:TetR/AcrR family transcriptional regulator [Nevskiaceae bacterium]